MELKTGYKQTEVGVIPSDWEVKTMGEIGEVKMCKRVFNHETQPDGAIPFFKIGTFGKEADAYISEEHFNSFRQKFSFPRKGEILISAAGTIGRTLVYDGKPAYFQDSNIVWIDNDETLVSNVFLYYIYQVVKYNTEGGTIQRLYNNILKSAKFALPSTPKEQTAIATALSDTDQYITHLEKLIAKKRNIKQGAMQELLRPKEGWVVKKLGEIGKTFGGLSGKTKADFQDGIFPYIPFMNIMNSPVIDTTYFDFVKVGASENQNKASKGDLFFNGSSETPEEVGMCSVLLENIPNLYLNSFCFGFRLFNAQEVNGIYLSYFFRSGEGRKLIFSLAQGATRYNLSKANFLKLVIPLPKVEEQTHIATFLSDMDSEIAALEAKLSKAQSIKQGMMQQLLTGKIRLV
jgi:type I restriction enzyme S subunit